MTTSPQDPFSKGEPGYGAPPSYGAPGGYGPAPAWGPSGQGGAPPTDTKAIVALVLSIGSFVVLPLVPAIIALVLASMSGRDISASGGQLAGAGLVLAAKIISWINIVLCALVVVFLVIVFGVLASSGFSE